MKRVIIGIHGLGNKPPKYVLQKWWKESMLEGFKTHNVDKDIPCFELVYWSDILYERPLNNWANDAENELFLEEPYQKAPEVIEREDHSIRLKLTDFLSDQLNKIFLNEDKTLNYSFLTDLILKKYFKDLNAYYHKEGASNKEVRNKTRDLVRNRVAKVIKKYKGYEIFIVAHSMGSIVAFDVLTYFIPEIDIHTFVTIGSPLGLPLVVSQIAAENKRHSNGNSEMVTPPGIKNHWYNMADIMDHIALNFKLADDFAPNERNVTPQDFLVENNYEINGSKNHHKSFGYLRTPEFSNVLSEFIGDEPLKFGQRIRAVLQAFIRRLKEQLEKFKGKLSRI